MSWQVRVRAAAENDLREARDWYERRRKGLGEEFLACAAAAIARIEERPEQFPEYYSGFRRALTPRFPYKVFFRVEGELVIVFRVLHAARSHAPILDCEHD